MGQRRQSSTGRSPLNAKSQADPWSNRGSAVMNSDLSSRLGIDRLEPDLMSFLHALMHDLRSMPPLRMFDLRDGAQAKEAFEHYSDLLSWLEQRHRVALLLKSELERRSRSVGGAYVN